MPKGSRVPVPPALDVALVVVLAAAMAIDTALCDFSEPFSAMTIPSLAVLLAPLAWRRHAPVPVLGLVIVGVFLALAFVKPVNTLVLAPMLATYTVAVEGDRRRSVIVGVVGVTVSTAGVAFASGRAQDFVFNVALMALAAVTGEAMRSRRAVLDAAAAQAAAAEIERERETERRVEAERLRLAQEVHDVVAHAMVAINVQAGVAAHLLEEGDEQQAHGALRDIKQVSGSALADLRATLGVLRGDDADAPVAPAVVLDDLPQLAVPLRSAGIDVRLDVDLGPKGALPAPIGATAYRIVQEALTNVLRHAAASQVDVRVHAAEDRLDVDVRDDGTLLAKVPAVPAGSGNGLRGITERAAAVGGTVDAGEQPGGGWRVHAILPVR